MLGVRNVVLSGEIEVNLVFKNIFIITKMDTKFIVIEHLNKAWNRLYTGLCNKYVNLFIDIIRKEALKYRLNNIFNRELHYDEPVIDMYDHYVVSINDEPYGFSRDIDKARTEMWSYAREYKNDYTSIYNCRINELDIDTVELTGSLKFGFVCLEHVICRLQVHSVYEISNN